MDTKRCLMKYFSMMYLSVVLVLMTGCRHRTPVMDLDSPELLEPGSIRLSVSSPELRSVNFAVLTRTQTDSAEIVAGILESRIEEELANRGLNQSPDQADYLIDITVSADMFDRFGDFVIYNSAADAEMLGPPDMNKIARKAFSARSERKLGRSAALADAASRLLTPLKDWLKTVLVPEKLRIASSVVEIVLPESADPVSVEYIDELIQAITAFSGVYDCRVVASDQRSVTFRVEYHADAFPEGMENRLTQLQQPPTRVFQRSVATVTLPEKYAMRPAEYTIMFIDTLRVLDGMKECKTLAGDPGSRAIRFEMVYDPTMFPEGLFNRIVSIRKLDIGVE